MSHVPGPWSYKGNGRGWNTLSGPDGKSIWTMDRDTDNANRRLIAAAPEMKALLLRVLNYGVPLFNQEIRDLLKRIGGQ